MRLYAQAREILLEAGLHDPGPDVKLLASHAAGRPLRQALGRPLPELDAAAEERFLRLVARRAGQREPVAYLVGTAEFMGLELEVTPAVLVPRPSTETLVQLAGRPETFLEIGTGSGAVAVALAVNGSSGTATDVSRCALEVARKNAARHGVADRITFLETDLFAEGTFDLVISNPPYVASHEFAGLQPEVLHEPRLALDGGAEGLDIIARIVDGARARGPRLLLECAPHQAERVRGMALGAGYARAAIHKDLDGFDRVVEAS